MTKPNRMSVNVRPESRVLTSAGGEKTLPSTSLSDNSVDHLDQTNQVFDFNDAALRETLMRTLPLPNVGIDPDGLHARGE
jgi:hypothetical protein